MQEMVTKAREETPDLELYESILKQLGKEKNIMTYFNTLDRQFEANGAISDYACGSKSFGLTWLFYKVSQFFKSIIGCSDYQKAYSVLQDQFNRQVDASQASLAAYSILALAACEKDPTEADIDNINTLLQSTKAVMGVAHPILLPLPSGDRPAYSVMDLELNFAALWNTLEGREIDDASKAKCQAAIQGLIAEKAQQIARGTCLLQRATIGDLEEQILNYLIDFASLRRYIDPEECKKDLRGRIFDLTYRRSVSALLFNEAKKRGAWLGDNPPTAANYLDLQKKKRETLEQRLSKGVTTYDSATGEDALPLAPRAPGDEFNEPHTKIIDPKCGLFTLRGKRPEMEDAHFNRSFIVGSEAVHADAILDGHSGRAVADWMAKEIPLMLEKELRAAKAEVLDFTNLDDVYNFESLLTKVCVEANLKYSREFPDSTSGSAMVMTVRFKGKVWCVNTGDSRAIQIKNNGKIVQLSEDAKPNIPRFKDSIEKRHGTVVDWGAPDVPRVSGNIAMARSFGDFHVQGMSARPKITLVDDDGVLVLACDGLWDEVTTAQAGTYARQVIGAGRKPHEVAAGLAIHAFNRGSGDNISVMVINAR